jgi:hypothetical protein
MIEFTTPKEKSPLQYFKEIKELSKKSFAVATSPNDNMFDRGVYKPGEGEVMQPTRIGSQDHLKYKSKGLLPHENKSA